MDAARSPLQRACCDGPMAEWHLWEWTPATPPCPPRHQPLPGPHAAVGDEPRGEKFDGPLGSAAASSPLEPSNDGDEPSDAARAYEEHRTPWDSSWAAAHPNQWPTSHPIDPHLRTAEGRRRSINLPPTATRGRALAHTRSAHGRTHDNVAYIAQTTMFRARRVHDRRKRHRWLHCVKSASVYVYVCMR